MGKEQMTKDLRLLLGKLPDVLNDQQKNKKISNILFILSSKKSLLLTI